MDAIIHKAIKNGLRADRLVNLQDNTKVYFYFKQEPVRRGTKDVVNMSHVVPSKGTMYDFIAGKHYKTLREWADANDRTLDDIWYGFNNQSGRAYLTLCQLMNLLDGTSVEEYEAYTQTAEVNTGRDNAANSIRDALQVIEYQMKRIDHLLNNL